MNQQDIIVEPKYQVSLCKDILRDFSKRSVIEPQVKFQKRWIVDQIQRINEQLDDSINVLRRIFDKEQEKIMNLDDIAINFAIQEKLEQIWQHQSNTFIKQVKENYINRQEAESTMMNLLNFIYLIIRRHNSSGQSCNFFLYLWRQTSTSPSIFDVFIYCDDWELSYRIIQILQDVKFEEAIKFQIKQSIVQYSFEEQIHMGFYLFTNISIAMTSQNHFHHKNRYNSLVEYQQDNVILFKKRDSSSFLVTNLSNLNIQEGDLVYKLDVANPSQQKRNQCLWDYFLQTIGMKTYLECNISQKQIEIFEAFIEFKYAILCKENFTQAAYFQIFYRRLASFASSNKLSILKNFCLQYMKREIHFNYISRQNMQHFSLNLVRDLLQKMENKGWILKRKDDIQESELQELKKDQFFRLVWDIIIFENGNVLHFLQEQYKIEGELFGKLEDFIFQYYLNTNKNAYIYTEEDMQFPNGTNIDTSSGFFQSFFQQFKTSYEKVIFSNDNCPVRKRMQEYDISITNWQLQILTNVATNPESFNGKQGIISQIQFHELIRRYNDSFRVTITDTFKDIFVMILDKCLDEKQNGVLTDIFIHRMILISSSQLTDQKRQEIIQQKGVQYFDQLFYQIIHCKNFAAAFTFLMLLEQGSDVFKNQLIEFILQSTHQPFFYIGNNGEVINYSDNVQETKYDDVSIKEESINDSPESTDCNNNLKVYKIRKQIILSVAECLIKDFGFCYDIFMSLSKTESFSLSSKQDLEKNIEIYNLYVKYYAQVYLNKGTVMMHSQFFNQPGIKLQLRGEMLKIGVLENLVKRIEDDLQQELEYYVNQINGEQERICKFAYRMMINAKYTYLIHNTKQYIDTTMILCNNSASPDEKKEIKAEIAKHSFIVLKLILTLNNLFTYGLSSSLSYLSNIRTTVLRFIEIITQNSSEDVDFNPLFCALFAGLESSQNSIQNNAVSALSLDQGLFKDYTINSYLFKKSDLIKLFDNFIPISNYYFNQDGQILTLSSMQEATVLKDARYMETLAFIIKKIIKSLSDSSKKALISKYFSKHHINNVQKGFEMAAFVQRRYVKELFKIRQEDLLLNATQQKIIPQQEEQQNELNNEINQNSKLTLIKSVTDEEILKLVYKRIKCFINVTRFGLALDIHGICAEQMQAFVTFRDSIISSYNYVFFGTTKAPPIFKKKGQQNNKKLVEELIKSKKMNKVFSNDQESNCIKQGKIQKKRKDNGKKGLIKFLKSKNVSLSEKIIIHQFVCMKYFNPLQKMLHFHLQAQTKSKTKKEHITVFLESSSFIKSITHLFKNSFYHIKQCKEMFMKNQSQLPIIMVGGAGGGGSSNMSLSYLDTQQYSKKSCLSMSNLIQLIFQEFSVFLMHRFSTQEDKIEGGKDKLEEKIPLLSDKSKSAGSLDNITSERRYVNLDDASIQDETLSDEITLSQISSDQNIQFCDETSNQGDDNDLDDMALFSENGDDDCDEKKLQGYSSSLDCEEDDNYGEDSGDEELGEEEDDLSNQNYSDDSNTNINTSSQCNGSNQIQSVNCVSNTKMISHKSTNLSQNQEQIFSTNQSESAANLNNQQISSRDNNEDEEELNEEQYADRLENEIQLNKQSKDAFNQDLFVQQKIISTESVKLDIQSDNKNLDEEKEKTQQKLLNDKQQASNKAALLKERELKRKQKYELYFLRLKYLISIVMKNLSQIEYCDVSTILLKIQEKQIGIKIDKLKAIQFFDTVFDSMESFDLSEAIPFKQFMNKFYHPSLNDESFNQFLTAKAKSANLESKQNIVEERVKQETEEQKQNTAATSQVLNPILSKQEQEKELEQKQRDDQFKKITDKLSLKIQKNKLTFLDITLLNSNQSDKTLQNSKIVLSYIKKEMIPSIESLNQSIEENLQQFEESQNQNLELKVLIDSQTKERRMQIISIVVTLSVISYYLQFIAIKDGEKQKIQSTFNIMAKSISLFQQCLFIIKSSNFYKNETIYYQMQAMKKICLIHQNLAQRYLQLSLQLILTSREESINLFIHHNILSITSNINMVQVDIFRNNISLVIFSIIYEIFNTPYNYYNTIEFSLKNYVFTSSKSSDYKSFSFNEKYNIPLDISAYQNEAKSLITKGPKDFMRAFQRIMSIDKLRKQKLKCYIKKRYRNQWCFPIKLNENQQKVIEQLYLVCKDSDTEGQIYDGMTRQQQTQAGSNNYLTDEIETDCMNNFCFGKILLNLLQYYPCIVGLGEKNPEYHRLLVDFMVQDSMGATKKLTKLYFTFYSLHLNNLSFLGDYWVKYSNQVDSCMPNWENSTKDLQKLFQSLHMIDSLQEVSSSLKYEDGLPQMKNFLQNIMSKLWDDPKAKNKQNASNTQDDIYFFQNYLNIPSIFAAFYKNYIKNCLYTLGFEEIYSQTAIYDYVKELKYCLQMTSMENYLPTINTIFKQPLHLKVQHPSTHILDKNDLLNSKNSLPSLVELSQTPLQGTEGNALDNLLQVSEQMRLEEITQVSQEFPFALHDNDKNLEMDQDLINEQVIAYQQGENEGEEEQKEEQTSLFDQCKQTENQSPLRLFDNTTPIGQKGNEILQMNENCDINLHQKSQKIDLFEGLKELSYGLKVDGAVISTGYIFQAAIKYCGLVENRFCNQQALNSFMGRDIQIIVNDATQYLMTNSYYKTKWKNAYSQFPLSQQNLTASLQKFFSKIPIENTKFSLLKEVNRMALHQYQQIMLKIQKQKAIDMHLDKSQPQLKGISMKKSKSSISGTDIEKNNKSNDKKGVQQRDDPKKNNNEDGSPMSTGQNKLLTADKKIMSSSKFKSNDHLKISEGNVPSDEDEITFELDKLCEGDEQGILNFYTSKLSSEGLTPDQIQEVILQKTKEVKNLIKTIADPVTRKKIQIVLARHYYYDIQFICQRVRETLANNSCGFVKDLFEFFAPLHEDIYLKQEVLSLHKASEISVNIVKTFIQLLNPYFQGQNLLKQLPFKDDPTNHYKVSLTPGKEYNFLQNRNPYTVDQVSKNKFDKLLSDNVIEQKKKINQYNEKIQSHLNKNSLDKCATIDKYQELNAMFQQSDLQEGDTLINEQTISIYSANSNQKYQVKLKKTFYDIIFDSSFEDMLIKFSHQMIDVSLAMQDQLSSEEDYISTLQSSTDQYEFLLIFLHHFENRNYLMEQLKMRMEGLVNTNKQQPRSSENASNHEKDEVLENQFIQNEQTQEENYKFNQFQKRNFPIDELKIMLQNRYLMLLNILINNNEGIYELFVESGVISNNLYSLSQEEERKLLLSRRESDNIICSGSMIQNFIREMGRSEHIIKSIQHQKTIKSNYKQFVSFYTVWFDRSFQYFKESYEPFFTQPILKKREKSINSFILNEDFIKVYTTMLLNDLTSTNYKTKVNFHIEKIIIRLNKDIIYALIKEISHVLVEQIEPVVNKLVESIKRIYKQMKQDLGGNQHNLERIDNNERDVYYNSFQQQSGKYVENLHSKCDKQFYLIKYMNSVFKIMLQQEIQKDFPLHFKQQFLQQFTEINLPSGQSSKVNFNNNLFKPSNDYGKQDSCSFQSPLVVNPRNKQDFIRDFKIESTDMSFLQNPHPQLENTLNKQNLGQQEGISSFVLPFQKYSQSDQNQIIDSNGLIQSDLYVQKIIDSLHIYEENIKEKYEEILLDSGCFNLYSKILIFSKYYSISLQAGLIYNDRQSKYFSSYAYFSRSYQSLFYLYKIIHSNHYYQVENIIKGEKKIDEVEECFDFPSNNSIDQNLPFLTTLQNASPSSSQNQRSGEGGDQNEEERKENKFSSLLQTSHLAEQMQQTVSSVSLQEREEFPNSVTNPIMINTNNINSNQDRYLIHSDHKSQKNLKTIHNLEDIDDEDLLGLNSMSTQELNLSCALKYHELFKFFIRLENVIYFCIVRQPQDFAKIIAQPLKDIQNRYSLYLKKMLIVSQTKFRVKKNINNNYTSSQSITIDRTKMIEESVPAVLTIKSEQLCLNTLYVKWKYESGIDEGGPRREWFSLIFNQLLDPNFGLFIQSKKNYTYMPNPFSFLVPDHLIYFKFLGILLGKAFLENYPVQANFAKPFLKLFLKKKIVITDIEEVDPELYRNLNWLLKNQINAEEMDINFIYDKFYAGQKYEIELKNQGKTILVSEDNKKEYVKSICHAKLIREIHYQAQAITSGFKEIICEDLLQVLDEQMLSFVFSGNPEISVSELKETIQLQGYTKNDKQIKWLFEILESFNNYEKSCFIFFITGSMNLPHGGFKQFPITITLTQKTERLPVAHTCANSIDLPNYPTKERLEDALRKALFECQGFELA